MKLIGYIRVSTVGQEDNTSLADQRRRISAYCEAFGHDLVQVFEEVGSAKDTQGRPQFQAALDALKGGVDGIIALKLDRIARNTRDVLDLVEDVLQPQNKALVLLDIQVDTSTPTGRMILTVMAAVAQLERDVIRERTQGGRAAKHRGGGYAYGSPHFGMRPVEGDLKPDEDEQKIIRVITEWRQNGDSYASIAESLNNLDYKTKRKKEWSAMQVKRVCDRVALDNK